MSDNEKKTENQSSSTAEQKKGNSTKEAAKHVDSEKLEASFSVLIMSIASSAALNLGSSFMEKTDAGRMPNSGPLPASDLSRANLPMARFNIDLLVMLQEKTKNQLHNDEAKLLSKLISDLQNQFVILTKKN